MSSSPYCHILFTIPPILLYHLGAVISTIMMVVKSVTRPLPPRKAAAPMSAPMPGSSSSVVPKTIELRPGRRPRKHSSFYYIVYHFNKTCNIYIYININMSIRSIYMTIAKWTFSACVEEDLVPQIGALLGAV